MGGPNEFQTRRTPFPSLTAAAGALALMTLTSSSALAAPEGTLDSMALDLGPGAIFAGIVIESSNGKNWTGIKESQVSLAGTLKIDLKHGRIKAFGIYLGQCDGHSCFEGVATPLLGSIHVDPPHVKSLEGTTSFSFSSLKLGDPGGGGIPVVPVGAGIVERCNAGLSQGQSIRKGFGFLQAVQVTLGADTRMWTGFKFGTVGKNFVLGNEPLVDVDFAKTFTVNIPVTCEAVPVTPGAGAPGQVGTKLPEYKLLGATLHGDPAQYAGACPMQIKLFMSATSNVPGPFVARVEAKSGWVSTPLNSQTSESAQGGTWAKHFQETMSVPVLYAIKPSDGGAKDATKGIGNVKMNPKAEEPVVPPGLPKGPKQVQAGYNPGNLHEDSLRLVVKSGDQAVTTDWWKYSVTCDPNKAKVAGDTPSGVKQSVFIQQAFLALFPVAPKDGSKCGLNVSGLIQTNVKNAEVTFRLKNHQGNSTNAQTIETTHANNIGKLVEYLDFSKSGQGSWVTPGGGWSMPGSGGSQAGKKTGTLQIVVEKPAKFEGNVASYNFACYDPVPVGLQQPPTVKVDPAIPQGPGSIVGKKNDARARQPDKVLPKSREGAKPVIVAPKPKLVCTGGSVRNNACVCRPGYAPTKTGATSYRCNRIAVLPPPVVVPKPTTPRRVTNPQIACAGGVVRSNRCVCPGGTRLQNGVCRAASAPSRSVTPQRVR